MTGKQNDRRVIILLSEKVNLIYNRKNKEILGDLKLN